MDSPLVLLGLLVLAQFFCSAHSVIQKENSSYHKPSAIWFHYIGENSDISTADISKTLQLPPKQSGWINGTTALYEATMLYGCFESGDGQVQVHWNRDQMAYADFKNGKAVWTAPLLEELEHEMLSWFYIVALVSRERVCKHYLAQAVQFDKSPTEDKAPTVLVYPREEAEPGEENTFYCYISHFYPPSANVTWTRNGVQVTEGATLSNFYPERDGTFSQLASLSVRPEAGVVLGCSVQHQALSRPVNATWALPGRSGGSGAAWTCLSLGLICLASGLFIFLISAKDFLRRRLWDRWRSAHHRAAG